MLVLTKNPLREYTTIGQHGLVLIQLPEESHTVVILSLYENPLLTDAWMILFKLPGCLL